MVENDAGFMVETRGLVKRYGRFTAVDHLDLRPPLLLLDEPTVGVDPELRVSFWDYFNESRAGGRPSSSPPITWTRQTAATASASYMTGAS